MIHRYGNIPVPATVMWSSEEDCYVAECPWFKVPAICQHEAPGEGVALFGRPHVVRQRKAMALCLCDLCAEPLKGKKFSLSSFGGDPPQGYQLSQVEPLLHRECVVKSLESCPDLRRQMARQTMRVRQVFKCRSRPVAASHEECARFIPHHNGVPVIGLAVMDIQTWRDVTDKFVA